MDTDVKGSFNSIQRRLAYVYAKESPNRTRQPSDSSDYIMLRRVIANNTRRSPTNSNSKSKTWVQIANIIGEAAGDQSGYSVSLSGDGTTIAIGAIFSDGGNGDNSGNVKVYKNTGGNWVQIGLDIGGEAENDNSGVSVSLSNDGNIIAIGASKHDSNSILNDDSGNVKVYKYNGGNWVQIGLDIDGEAAGDQSGYSVSLSGDGTTIAIGAINSDGGNNVNDNRGNVKVYKKTGGNWVQIGLDIGGEAAGDKSGYSVSLSDDGNTIAIGAIQHDGENTGDVNDNRGNVKVYKNTVGNWVEIANFDGEAANDNSGWCVSLSGDGTTIAIGAVNHDNRGNVKIYKDQGANINSRWVQTANFDGEAESDRSGHFVSLSNNGSIIAIGAIQHDGENTGDVNDNRGNVKVYKLQ